MEPVSCPYPLFRVALCAEAGGGREIFVRIHGLRGDFTILFREELNKFEKIVSP